MRKTVTELTAAQINHLGSAPVSVVPAPGAGRAIIPVSVTLQHTAGTVAFGDAQFINPMAVFFDGTMTKLENGHSPPFIVGYFVTFSYPVSTFGFASPGVIINSAAGVASFVGVSMDIPLTSVENKSLLLHSLLYNDDDNIDYIDYGAIDSNDLNVGGSGYIVGDIGVVGGTGTSHSAEFVVDSVDGSGAVVDYHLTSNGYGYKIGVGPTGRSTGGGDNNFSININSITPGNGSGKVIVIYDIIHV